ncbi:MAG TPA: M48 family metalloprotease, partial [Myxococcota bacterium]|nr:M48 family metalloprotease [Myxococcota bacterium]
MSARESGSRHRIRESGGRRAGAILLLGLAVLGTAMGCARVPLAPLDAQQSTASLADDEAYLWKQTRETQFEIESSGLVLEDPAMDAYLARVLARVTPSSLVEAGVTPRVQVISDVAMHGYSFANGVIYLHVGLLARMTDETQLATVLTRELAHVIHRHALVLRRDAKGRADAMAWIGVGSSLSSYGGGAKMLAQAYSISTAVMLPQDLEVKADEEGLGLLAAAGYDVKATPDFFQMTLDYRKELHQQGPLAWMPYVAPPFVTGRITNYRQLLGTRFSGGNRVEPPIADPATFRRNVHPATRRQAELELAAGVFRSAERTAKLATESDPSDAQAWVLLGRALQGQRDKPMNGYEVPSIHRVREAYEHALELDPRDAAATRELGLSYYRKTSRVRAPEASRAALAHFRRYLALAPGATDEAYIRATSRSSRRKDGGGPVDEDR